MTQSQTVSMLIAQWQEGQEIHVRLMPLIYQDLRVIAGSLFPREGSDHTLQPTALVTEAYLRLRAGGPWQSRAHFFGSAARAMREALIDAARRRKALKRGGMFEHVPLDSLIASRPEESKEIVGIDKAIRRLEEINPRWAQIVELRFFAGLSVAETAATMKVSPGTVRADWTKAKAWLQEYIGSL